MRGEEDTGEHVCRAQLTGQLQVQALNAPCGLHVLYFVVVTSDLS